jgi:hypothetical protein
MIPSNLVAQDLATYLDDIFHEFAKFGKNVEEPAMLPWLPTEESKHR